MDYIRYMRVHTTCQLCHGTSLLFRYIKQSDIFNVRFIFFFCCITLHDIIKMCLVTWCSQAGVGLPTVFTYTAERRSVSNFVVKQDIFSQQSHSNKIKVLHKEILLTFLACNNSKLDTYGGGKCKFFTYLFNFAIEHTNLKLFSSTAGCL